MHDLVRVHGFWEAFATAGVGTVLVVLLGWRGHRVLAGAPTVLAMVVGLGVADYLDAPLLVGIVLVALVGRLAAWPLLPPMARRVLALPGALLLAAALPDAAPDWVGLVTVLAVVVAVPRAARLAREGPDVAPLLLLVSAVGIYVCVPETSTIGPLVGAIVPVAFAAVVAAWRSERVPSGAAAPAVAAALLVWAAAAGGYPRSGSVVGGIGALGVVWIGGRRALRRRRPSTRTSALWRRPVIVTGLVHVAVVVYAARVAGMRNSGWLAAALLVPVLGVGALVLRRWAQPASAR